jgi:glutaminase
MTSTGVLELFFRQCSIRVTAHDLANRGINPVTGEQVVSANAVTRTLSVLISSGMYDDDRSPALKP